MRCRSSPTLWLPPIRRTDSKAGQRRIAPLRGDPLSAYTPSEAPAPPAGALSCQKALCFLPSSPAPLPKGGWHGEAVTGGFRSPLHPL